MTDFDFNCKSCNHFRNKPLKGSNRYGKNLCSIKGKFEFDCACFHWEPDLTHLSENLKVIKEQLTELSYAELQAMPGLIKQRLEDLKSNCRDHHKVGRCGYYRYRTKKFRIKIQNISETMIFGVKKTAKGFRRFRVLPDAIKKI